MPYIANAPISLKGADGYAKSFLPGQPITGMPEDWEPGEHLTSGEHPKVSPAPGSEPAGKSKTTKKPSRAAAGDEEGSA